MVLADFDAYQSAQQYVSECYKDKEIMHGLISRAMQADFSFDRSAEDYTRHYIWML